MPSDLTFTYYEVRWMPTAGKEPNDWEGRSSHVIYSASVTSYQITGLTADTEYKAKLFISVTDGGGATKYIKSATVLFTVPGPTPTPTPEPTPTPTPEPLPVLNVTSAGAATWSYDMPSDLTFTYYEVRWMPTAGKAPDDWEGRSNHVIYSDRVTSYQIPVLTEGVEYKAKLFISATDIGGATKYIKSATVVFTVPSKK